jgi:hypothetical protein
MSVGEDVEYWRRLSRLSPPWLSTKGSAGCIFKVQSYTTTGRHMKFGRSRGCSWDEIALADLRMSLCCHIGNFCTLTATYWLRN